MNGENQFDRKFWKILVIGLGSIAKRHISAIRSLGLDAQIFALRSSAKSEVLTGIENIYSLSEIDGKPDFVLISNPTRCHYDSIYECLKLSVPLFIEKPVLDKLEQAGELLNAIERDKITTYVGCNIRFLHSISFIKNYIEQRAPRINEVNVYCGSYLPNWRPNQDFRQSYSSMPELGGGVHLDLIHELDYIKWIFGQPINVKKILRSKSSLDISSVDYANYVILYSAFTASVILNYYRITPRRTLEIVTDNDVVNVDLLNNSVCSNCDGVLIESEQTIVDTYVAQMKYFVECVMKRSDTFNNFSEGVKVLSICLKNDKFRR